MKIDIQPFRFRVAPEDIEDLNRRLDMTRWPDEIQHAQGDYGIPLAFMQEMIRYWRHEFDWSRMERNINAYPNYIADIDGHRIHFIHIKSSGASPIPLLLAHGWPSTFYEMLELVPYLTETDTYGDGSGLSFDIVIPSIPGHGFSIGTREPGFEDRQAGQLLGQLMAGLGYDRFGAHGYDIGASILGLLCLDQPESIIGYHTTSPANPSPYTDETTILTPEETEYLDLQRQWYASEGGYAHLLGTKPQTAAYGLEDSPAGLAAFILEKWHDWTYPKDGDLLQHFSRDFLISNVAIYWLTRTINSSNRYYYEGRHTRWPGPGESSPVPHGIALTSEPNTRPPRAYVERIFPNLIRWKDLNIGGHFIAAEQPKLLAEQIRGFFHMLQG
ncbi:epoxide hydrolase family protein [Paenibacillus campinasensis]|uniref:epoxide hydrolase family protein n=1 Tax=Paenibacillus campinasensis TaxID=66347 RepID=UPI001FD273E8|nr:epoxide hydrolase family protein [Paenibacillus campinasensis]